MIREKDHKALVAYWREQAVWAAKRYVDAYGALALVLKKSQGQLKAEPGYQRAQAIGKEGEG